MLLPHTAFLWIPTAFSIKFKILEVYKPWCGPCLPLPTSSLGMFPFTQPRQPSLCSYNTPSSFLLQRPVLTVLEVLMWQLPSHLPDLSLICVFSEKIPFHGIYVVVFGCLVTPSCPTLLQPHRLYIPPGVGCQSLLEGIFPTQELNPSLLHCRQILYRLS